MSQPHGLTQLAAFLALCAPKDVSAFSIARDAERLVTISAILNGCDTRSCNGYRDPAIEKRDDATVERVLAEAKKIAASYELFASHQGDPRGVSLYLNYSETLASGQGFPVYR